MGSAWVTCLPPRPACEPLTLPGATTLPLVRHDMPGATGKANASSNKHGMYAGFLLLLLLFLLFLLLHTLAATASESATASVPVTAIAVTVIFELLLLLLFIFGPERRRFCLFYPAADGSKVNMVKLKEVCQWNPWLT